MTAILSTINPDDSSRAGLFLGALAVGSSFQPNLLSRGTRDQALISAMSAVAGYGVAAAGHSVLGSIGRRLPGDGTLSAEVLLAVAGAAVVRAVPVKEHGSQRLAGVRLAGIGATVVGLSALVSRGTDRLASTTSGIGSVGIKTCAVLATATTAYLALRPQRAKVGSLGDDGELAEDSNREVRPPVALAVSALVTTALIGVGHGESMLARLTSTGAAKVLGGEAADHRTLGRLVVFGATALALKKGIGTITSKLAEAGDSVEEAHQTQPDLAEVTGSPQSGISWSAQSREGRRWLSMVLREENIGSVMGEDARQPIRVYAALNAATADDERAELLLREIDRTNALDRSVVALFSPTGSGYVNYVACETFEYLTRGDCASACIEYSVLPSSLSLTAVPLGSRQTRLVVDGIVKRLLARAPADRPRFVLFGESLGSQVSQDMFTSQGVSGLEAVGLDAAVWIGTPASTQWRQQLWGTRRIADKPGIGPGSAFLPRSIADWQELEQDERAKVDYLLLQNGDDPVPKFGEDLVWRQPDWLGADYTRPDGAPRGTKWIPFVTFLQTFIDLMNALTPIPGTFAEGGHDYRTEIPEALRTVWKLEASDEQMSRVQSALRERELGWEVARSWRAAQAIHDPKKRAEAEQKSESSIGQWTGSDGGTAGAEQIEKIIADDTQPD